MKPLWANFAFNGFVKKKAITIKMSGKRASYSMKFKINAAKYAKETNVSEASRNFEVDRKRIREWVSHFDAGKLQEQATSSKRLSGGGRKLRDVDIDQDIFEWFTDRQSQGMRVTGKALLVEAQRRFFAGGITAFKASRGWLEKWKTRHSVLTRVKTTVAQKMPPQMEDKILSFHRFVIRMRKLRNYPLANIGNMDETAVYFDMPGDSTLHHKGEKTVIIRTTGHEKDKVTVILAAMADGRKLLPVVILKGKREPPASDVPRGVLVKMSNNGWVNEDIIKWWVVQVWRRSADRKLLVWDAFRAHRTKAVKELLSQRSEFGANSDTVMMPGGCTSILQPADVSWNKPFKSYIQEKWDRWMVDGQHTFTPAGRMRKPENKVCHVFFASIIFVNLSAEVCMDNIHALNHQYLFVPKRPLSYSFLSL